MLIVGQARGVCAHVSQDGEVFFLVCIRDCPSLDGPVLMHGHTFEIQVLAVEEETLVGIESDRTQPQRLSDPVEQPSSG